MIGNMPAKACNRKKQHLININFHIEGRLASLPFDKQCRKNNYDTFNGITSQQPSNFVDVQDLERSNVKRLE